MKLTLMKDVISAPGAISIVNATFTRFNAVTVTSPTVIGPGPVIVGTLWGAQAPLTALGDNVNVASRIEQANKECGTRFLISEPARADLGEAVVTGRSFTCCLPGKAGEHTLIEVLGSA